jgi:hypothetical protein
VSRLFCIGGRAVCGDWRCISPFQEKKKLDFLDQPASGALGRDAIAIGQSDRFPVFFYRLEWAY